MTLVLQPRLGSRVCFDSPVPQDQAGPTPRRLDWGPFLRLHPSPEGIKRRIIETFQIEREAVPSKQGAGLCCFEQEQSKTRTPQARDGVLKPPPLLPLTSWTGREEQSETGSVEEAREAGCSTL